MFCVRLGRRIHIKVLISTWKTICSPLRLNIKRGDHSESFQDGENLVNYLPSSTGHPDPGKWRCLLLDLLLSQIRDLFGEKEYNADFVFECHTWLGSFGRHVFVVGFRRDRSKNVVIYKDINYAKQPAYKRDIDRVLLHGIVKMPVTDIMSHCVYIL